MSPSLLPPDRPIQPLPADVAQQVHSSTTITSLNTVALELVKNSLDASASKIHVTIDYPRGSCSVEDDGCGIAPQEFQIGGGLGKMQHSSKVDRSYDYYGHKGSFLASVASLSVLTIVSRYRESSTTNAVSFHDSRLISRLLPVPRNNVSLLARHGATVSVHNLFGNMPVRIKHRAQLWDSDFGLDRLREDLTRALVGLLLAFAGPIELSVSFSTRLRKLTLVGPVDAVPSSNSFNLQRVHSLLSSGGFLGNFAPPPWVTASASTSRLSIRAAISLEPAATKNVQFVSFGKHPLFPDSHANAVFDEVNRLFMDSNFGTLEDTAPALDLEACSDNEHGIDHFALRKQQLNTGYKKRPEKWPMFYIRIECCEGISNAGMVGAAGNEASRALARAIEVLGVLVVQFLRDHHFISHKRKPRSSKEIPSVEHSAAKNVHIGVGGNQKHRNSYKERSSNIGGCPESSAAPIPRTTFGSWSRVKGCNPTTLLDLRSGLPRTRATALPKALRSQSSELLDKTSSLEDSEAPTARERTFQCQRNDAVQSSDSDQGNGEMGSSLRPDNGGVDPIITWTDPVNKRAISINSRTGTVLRESTNRLPLVDVPLAMRPHTAGSVFVRRFPTRPRSSCTDSALSDLATDSWLGGVLQSWENPVFAAGQTLITSVDDGVVKASGQSGHCCTRLAKRDSARPGLHIPSTLSREGFCRAEVVAQVDHKFIMTKVPASMSPSRPLDSEARDTLVLIDQHAADERCRIEELLKTMFVDDMAGGVRGTESLVHFTNLLRPLFVDIPSQERGLFFQHRQFFARWGIIYEISDEKEDQIPGESAPLSRATTNVALKVIALPDVIASRCMSDPQLVRNLLRTEVWSSSPLQKLPKTFNGSAPCWVHYLTFIPRTLLDMLNSRACRSAIMFNDPLTIPECETLVRRLSSCVFPWSCAHGRPTLISLVELESNGPSANSDYGVPSPTGLTFLRGSLVKNAAIPEDRSEVSLRAAWQAWRVRDGSA